LKNWISFWFNSDTAKQRKRWLASLLLLLLGAIVVLPLIDKNGLHSYLRWVNAGQSWQVMIVPAVTIGILLLIPTTRISVGGNSLEPLRDPIVGEHSGPRLKLRLPDPTISSGEIPLTDSPYDRQEFQV
jgi:hypothetical protein